jgi:tRNA nucleotidyltransferase/poly(A) polymerase
MPQLFKVGGCVRDELLGLQSKDIDFTFVLDDLDQTVEQGFQQMTDWMVAKGFQIFLSTPECFTIRAKFPKDHKYQGVADFVMARKEVGYIPGTRTPMVVPGSLYDDLERRDFTLNALAKDEDGKIIDFFDGLKHLKAGQLITPLDCKVTFDDDPLRILRAIRFCITKGFFIGGDMAHIMQEYDYDQKMRVVSVERIREELFKCFKHDTLKTLMVLHEFPKLKNYIFQDHILWLKPTMEK